MYVIFYHRTVHSNESRTSSAHVTFRTILVYCLCTIRYGLGRCFWGELYTHTSSDTGSSLQPWPLCCPTHPYSQPLTPPHQHQPLPPTHSIGPRCAFGNTCHVPDLPYTHRLSISGANPSLVTPDLATVPH